MLNTTVGQLLVNDVLPADLRDYHRTLDNKTLKGLLRQVASQHPEKYRDVAHQLNQIGRTAAQEQGGMSFGMTHLRKSDAARKTQQRIQQQLDTILADESLSDKDRAEAIILAVHREKTGLEEHVLEEAKQKGNPLALQVLSGSRGKPMNLASLVASDMLYSDHRDEVIPIPVLRSYSEGLSPEEYWAGTYGARRGIIATKFATQEAGFLSKQLNQAGHRLVVMDEDSPEEQQDNVRGLVVDTDDSDNEGALLARDVGPYVRNTPLTPKILKHISRLGHARILVRSPIIGGSPEGGVYARDVGVRENGGLPGRGEQVGLQAAQALSEPISQGQLSAKHSGGVAGKEKAVGGFAFINQLIQTPKTFMEGAAHATQDGAVQRIEPAPAGGQYVFINGQRHYVGTGHELKIKKGDQVEAGDVISEGIPNPAIITQYKGVGEGRRYFVNEFKKSMANSGMYGHRRNIELLARGLINHVRLTEETENNVPDDVIPYSTLEHTYKPRENHEVLNPEKALGQYLERPVLHYTIGTQVKPSMLKNFTDFGVKSLTVHKNPPPFEPHMVRGMYQLQHDPDWMTQMYGSGLKKSLLNSVARGGVSEERGTSFVPSLATGTDFGDVPDRAVIKPLAPYAVDTIKSAFSQIDPFLLPVKLAAPADVPGAPSAPPKAPAPSAPQPVKPVTPPAPVTQPQPYRPGLGTYPVPSVSIKIPPVTPQVPPATTQPAAESAVTQEQQPQPAMAPPVAQGQTGLQKNPNLQPVQKPEQPEQPQTGMSPQMQTMMMLSLLGAGGGYGFGGGQGAMLGGMGLPLMYYLLQQMQKPTQAPETDYDNRYREIQNMQATNEQASYPATIPTDAAGIPWQYRGVESTRPLPTAINPYETAAHFREIQQRMPRANSNLNPAVSPDESSAATQLTPPSEQNVLLDHLGKMTANNVLDSIPTKWLMNRYGQNTIESRGLKAVADAPIKLYRAFVPGAGFSYAGTDTLGTAGGWKGYGKGVLAAIGGQTLYNGVHNALSGLGMMPKAVNGPGWGVQDMGREGFDERLRQGVAEHGPLGYITGYGYSNPFGGNFSPIPMVRDVIENPIPAGANLASGIYEINRGVPGSISWLLHQTGMEEKLKPHMPTQLPNAGKALTDAGTAAIDAAAPVAKRMAQIHSPDLRKLPPPDALSQNQIDVLNGLRSRSRRIPLESQSDPALNNMDSEY